jgi:large subunit ribosomal protein L9
LYGSVNAGTVVEELAKKGIEIDRKKVVMKDIKTVGEYAATVIFHKEVRVEIPVTVLAEGNIAEQPKAVEPKQAPVVVEPEAPAVEEEEQAEVTE